MDSRDLRDTELGPRYSHPVGSQARVIKACAVLSKDSFALAAIDGPGGSGKSTLARLVQTQLEASVIIEMDDSYRPISEAQREALSPREGFNRFFDWQRSVPRCATHSALGRRRDTARMTGSVGRLPDARSMFDQEA
jgi:hypothetical protein